MGSWTTAFGYVRFWHMLLRLLVVGLGVTPLFVAAPASALSCSTVCTAHDPAPPGAGVWCARGSLGSEATEGALVPVLGTESGSEVDATRETVSVTLSELDYGWRFGAPSAPLSAGAWRLDVENAYGASFVVDPDLSDTPAAVPTFEAVELVSDYEDWANVTVVEDVPVGYVHFSVGGAPPPYAVEVYAVTAGERSTEPASEGGSFYDQFDLGYAYRPCGTLFGGEANATYDVRVAAYSASGERGEWSAFERVVVPEKPEPLDDGAGGAGGSDDREDLFNDEPPEEGCAVRGVQSPGWNWTGLGLVFVALGALRRRARLDAVG